MAAPGASPDAAALRLARELQGAVLRAADALTAAGGADASATATAARLAPLLQLLASGADADLDMGCRNEGSEIVTPLLNAVRAGDEAAALALIASRRPGVPDVGSPLCTALALPALRPRLVPLLLAAGCDIAAQDGRGACALHAAVRAGVTAEALGALMQAAAPAALAAALITRDRTGATPLHAALTVGAPEAALRALLHAPGGAAAASVPDRAGTHPLGLAPDVAFARELLAAGADADARSDKSTPLGRCLVRGMPAEMISLLLAAGAQPLNPPPGPEDESPLRPSIALALMQPSYWPEEGEGEGAAICEMMLASLRAAGEPLFPPAYRALRLWSSCVAAPAARWLAAAGPGVPPMHAHGAEKLRELYCRRAKQYHYSWRKMRSSALLYAAQVAGAAAPAHGAAGQAAARAMVAGAQQAAAEVGAAVAARAAEVALRATVPAGAPQEGAAAALAALHDLLQVAAVAIRDAGTLDGDVALALLRAPPPYLPQPCAALLAARWEGGRAGARPPPPPFVDHRGAAGVAHIAACMAAALQAAPLPPPPPQLQQELDEEARRAQPQQHEQQPQQEPIVAAAAAPRVTLVAALDGGRVSAPEAALRELGVLHSWCEGNDAAVVAALGGDAAALPPLQMCTAHLELLAAFLDAPPPAHAAAAWLTSQLAAAPPDGMSLLRLLLSTDEVQAPPAFMWAAAEVAAHALLAEGKASGGAAGAALKHAVVRFADEHASTEGQAAKRRALSNSCDETF
jgi:hypothetical protein